MPEFTEIDALPRAQCQAAMGDGNREAYSQEGTFGMCRHIVGAFHGVQIERLVLLDHAVHDALHIRPYVRVGILVEGESA